MSFTTFISEFFAAALKEFVLHRPIHLELTRKSTGDMSFRATIQPTGDTARSEIHYHGGPPAPPYYPPVQPNPWGGWQQQLPYQPQAGASPAAERPPERPKETPPADQQPDPIVIPANWRP